MANRSARRTHADRVLNHFRARKKPLSAYQFLEARRAEGVTAATTVYRALDQLVAAGRVQRLASPSAWTARCDRHHAATPIFEIGEDRGAVKEHIDVRLAPYIAALSEPTGFAPDRSVTKIRGRCGTGREAAPSS